MKKHNENEGRWVTIRGRKVFIKEGQSLSEAMKTKYKPTDKKERPKISKVDQQLKGKIKTWDQLEKHYKQKYDEAKGVLPFKERTKIYDDYNRVQHKQTRAEWEEYGREAMYAEREREQREYYEQLKREEEAKKKEYPIEEYTEKEIKKSADEIKEMLKNDGVPITNNINEAIYIFPDGTMVDGMFMSGFRTEDHRILYYWVGHDLKHFKDANPWASLHSQTDVLRLVPEEKVAYHMENQYISEIQKKQIKKAGYDLTAYVKKPKKYIVEVGKEMDY